MTPNKLLKKSKLKEYQSISVRLIAIANLLKGMNQVAVGKLLGVYQSTISDWHKRYKNGGLDGLFDKPRPGKIKTLTPKEEEKIKERCLADHQGLKTSGQVLDYMAKHFHKTMTVSGVNKMLLRLKIVRRVPRPVHQKNNPELSRKWKRVAPLFCQELDDKTQEKN